MSFKYSSRFKDLLQQSEAIGQTKYTADNKYTGKSTNVEADQFLAWRVKCRNILKMACGETSEHYQIFRHTESSSNWSGNWHELKMLTAVIRAAEEDYSGGYLQSVRSLVHAEVLIDELEQARALLEAGYSSPAAVVAGVVLETKLREMCISNDVPTGKLDKMNADLVKAQAYNLAVQKRITALADIRNSAAHGRPESFKNDDVADMISYTERFLADYQ